MTSPLLDAPERCPTRSTGKADRTALMRGEIGKVENSQRRREPFIARHPRWKDSTEAIAVVRGSGTAGEKTRALAFFNRARLGWCQVTSASVKRSFSGRAEKPMSQDTRKDKRAKVVSLNVRYKSATVDEFIENHSHDVSKGGIFVKTPTPFPPGTLLKFEIRLAGDKSVLWGSVASFGSVNPPGPRPKSPPAWA